MARPKNPASHALDLHEFSRIYTESGGSLTETSRALKITKDAAKAALARARKQDLLPPLSTESPSALATRAASQIYDLRCTPPPKLPAGVIKASTAAMNAPEVLRRLSFLASASITPFVEFITAVAPQPVESPQPSDATFSPDGDLVPKDDSEGLGYEAHLTAASLGRALRAGYGPLIKEISYDNNGRLKLKLHDAKDALSTLARILGLERQQNNTFISIGQLAAVASLPEDQQRERAINAIRTPRVTGHDLAKTRELAEHMLAFAENDPESIGSGDREPDEEEPPSPEISE
jgi:hypothetical protein